MFGVWKPLWVGAEGLEVWGFEFRTLGSGRRRVEEWRVSSLQG